MTSVPKTDLPTTSYTCVYDAWNRVVRIVDGSTTVAEYSYDGRNFRVLKKTYSSGVLSETRHLYYSNDWKVLEERASSANPVPSPESLTVTDPLGHVTSYDYDGLGRRTSATDANGGITSYAYNRQNEVTVVSSLVHGGRMTQGIEPS